MNHYHMIAECAVDCIFTFKVNIMWNFENEYARFQEFYFLFTTKFYALGANYDTFFPLILANIKISVNLLIERYFRRSSAWFWENFITFIRFT